MIGVHPPSCLGSNRPTFSYICPKNFAKWAISGGGHLPLRPQPKCWGTCPPVPSLIAAAGTMNQWRWKRVSCFSGEQNLRRLKSFTRSTVFCDRMRLNKVALCQVHRHFGQALGLIISRKWWRNLFREKTVVGHCFENILILRWLSRTFCLSGLMNGKNQQESQPMQEWLTERCCRGSGAWAWKRWDLKLTQSDNGWWQPACQISSPSVHPFCRNSRFCPWPC